MTCASSIEIILDVPSVEDAAAWYERMFGWKPGFDIYGADGLCDFGGVCINQEPHLFIDMARVKGNPAAYRNLPCNMTLLIYVDDIDSLYRRVLANGGQPDSPPADQFWGARTFSMRDLNGFLLNFAERQEEVQGEALQRRYERCSE